MLIKVSKNIYGNYRGHVTGLDPVQLGCSEYDATAWASDQLKKYPGAKLSLLSDIYYPEVKNYRERLA